MKPWELYSLIGNIDYRKSGFDLDWQTEVYEDIKTIRLYFKCSTTWKDWLINILGFIPIPRLVKGRLIFFCMGWKKVFDGCSDLILNSVINLNFLYPDYKIEICGHSYGGAMSIIAGIELFKRCGLKADIITFGAPRPLFLFWSKLMAKTCVGEVIQYAHRSDFITLCPPLPFYHNVRIKKIGKLNLRDMFTRCSDIHTSYGDKELYI